MRISSLSLLPLPILSFVVSSPSQAIFDAPPRTASVTLIDKLSNDTDYTSLIKLLQHAKLIPTLNRLDGSTFFAPTNDAIAHHAASNPLWNAALFSDPAELMKDNINEQLRDQLFYHLLNYTVSLPNDTDVLVAHTLHFPHEHTQPPTDEPPPLPPWMPVPGGTLGGESQRLRLASREGAHYVGVDANGKGGAKLVKGVVDAGNGLLMGINSVLHTPSHLGVYALSIIFADVR